MRGKGKKTVMGIDSSSKSVAYCVMEVDGEDWTVVDYGKIVLPPQSMSHKLKKINESLPAVFEANDIDAVVIEQTIYIQSPQTSRILSYIVGALFISCLQHCKTVTDVQIMKWKNFIGYKNVTKTEIADWTRDIGKKEAKKKAAVERKARTERIVKDTFPGLSDVDDNDIMDSVGVAMWAAGNLEEVFNGTV